MKKKLSYVRPQIALLQKRLYVRPQIETLNMEIEELLQNVSGQHNPIGNGGTYGDAKRGFFSDEEEEDIQYPELKSVWED